MTIAGYHVTMKQVGIAALKARLSEYLREVRRGRTLTVVDRETPVARIVPYEANGAPLVVRRPRRTAVGLQRVKLPPPLRVKADVVALLLEERRDRP